MRKTIILAISLAFLAWFIPPIWVLSSSYITVTQFRKSTGEIKIDVGPGKSSWIDAKSVSRHVLSAFVAAEDMRFYEHFGVDFYEINESFRTNIRKGKYARGGSTITQQVVKMSMLSREKSIVRKLREVVGALLVESFYSKDEILTWYINLSEFGDGIYGLRAAAKHYFQTKPELLTIQQAAHLALVLPSPNGWSVGLRRKNLTTFGDRRYTTIVTRMKLAGYITNVQWLNALATGNFGRPVKYYESWLAKQQANAGAQLEPALPQDETTPDEEETEGDNGADSSESPLPSEKSVK